MTLCFNVVKPGVANSVYDDWLQCASNEKISCSDPQERLLPSYFLAGGAESSTSSSPALALFFNPPFMLVGKASTGSLGSIFRVASLDCCCKIMSIQTMAAIDSTMLIARGTTQGS